MATEYYCSDCGSKLVKRNGKFGTFWGCSNYPNCTSKYPDKDGKPAARIEREEFDLFKECEGHWVEILKMAGIPATYLDPKGGHMDCPLCKDGVDRYRFADKSKGHEYNGMYYCNVCGHGNGLRLYARYKNITEGEAAKEIRDYMQKGNVIEPKEYTLTAEEIEERRKKAEQERKETIARVRKTYDKCGSIENTQAQQYLSNRAVYPPEFGIQEELKNLRFGNIYHHKEDNGEYVYKDAMVAAMTNADGEFIAIHRTFIENGKKYTDGKRKAKMALGDLQDSAIRIIDNPDAHVLLLSEGIENALAGYIIFCVMGLAAPDAISVYAAGASGWMKNMSLEKNKFTHVIGLSDGDKPFNDAFNILASRVKEEEEIEFSSLCVGDLYLEDDADKYGDFADLLEAKADYYVNGEFEKE